MALDSPISDALAALPHGPSFRFIDALVTLVPGRSGVGRYHVRGDEAFLTGHFPGAPMVPGVILIEAVAQLAGVVAQCDPSVEPLDDVRLTAVRAAKISSTAAPGECLEIQVQITGRLGSLIQAEGTVTAHSRPLLTTQIVLSGRPRELVRSPPTP